MKNLLLALTVGTFAFAAASSHAADQAKPYALDYCVFSGDKIGEMGKPVTEVYEGQEMKFCCKDCQKSFDKDPAAGLKKYNTAVASKSSGGSNAAH
jgi:YHS domain-containing protein